MRTLKPLEKEEALRGKLQALAQSVSGIDPRVPRNQLQNLFLHFLNIIPFYR